MKGITRWIIAVALVLAVVVIAGNNIAWADTVDQGLSGIIVGKGDSAPLMAGVKKGTVIPPVPIKKCLTRTEVYSLYGIALLGLPDEPEEEPDDFDSPWYCIEAVTWNRRFPPGRLPDEVDKLLTNLIVLRVYIYSDIVDEVPHEVPDNWADLDDADIADIDGDVGEIALCFNNDPLYDDEQIYFFDFFGPRFSRPNPDWSPSVTIQPDQIKEYFETRYGDLDDVVCTRVLASGAYVLVDKK